MPCDPNFCCIALRTVRDAFLLRLSDDSVLRLRCIFVFSDAERYLESNDA